MLTIQSDTDSFVLTRDEANDLELKLNVTTVGRIWRPIGDVLFNFSVQNREALTSYAVTSEQFVFLQQLRQRKGWSSCKGLAPAQP